MELKYRDHGNNVYSQNNISYITESTKEVISGNTLLKVNFTSLESEGWGQGQACQTKRQKRPLILKEVVQGRVMKGQKEASEAQNGSTRLLFQDSGDGVRRSMSSWLSSAVYQAQAQPELHENLSMNIFGNRSSAEILRQKWSHMDGLQPAIWAHERDN